MGHDTGEDHGKQAAATMAIDGALVRELAELLADTGLTEIEVEDGARKIRVARHAPVIQQTAYAPAPVAASLQPAPTAPAAPVEAPVEHHADAVKSPMVGTCYLSPEPGAAPFKGVGELSRRRRSNGSSHHGPVAGHRHRQ